MDPLDEKRNGYSLADVAEIMTQMSTLKTDLGERGFQGPFLQFLRSKGLTEAQWVDVYNDWNDEMNANPGLAAKFHTYMAQVQQRPTKHGVNGRTCRRPQRHAGRQRRRHF